MFKYHEKRIPGWLCDRVFKYSYIKLFGRKIPIVTEVDWELNRRWKLIALIPVALLGLLAMVLTETQFDKK